MPNVTHDRWQSVRSGLTWITVGLLMMFVAAIGLIASLVWVFLSENPNVTAVETLPAMLWLIVFLFVGGHLFDFIGILRCLVVPVPRLLGWVVGHLICFLLSVGLTALAVFLLMRMVGPRQMVVIVIFLGIVNNLLSLTTAILMAMFLRGIAKHFSDDSLARHCGQYIGFQLFFWLLAMGGGFVPIALALFDVTFISPATALIAVPMFLGIIALLLDLLSRARQTIGQAGALPNKLDGSSGATSESSFASIMDLRS